MQSGRATGSKGQVKNMSKWRLCRMLIVRRGSNCIALLAFKDWRLNVYDRGDAIGNLANLAARSVESLIWALF